MLHLVYNIAAILAVILFMPVFCVRAVREKGFVQRIKQQFGFGQSMLWIRLSVKIAYGFMPLQWGKSLLPVR